MTERSIHGESRAIDAAVRPAGGAERLDRVVLAGLVDTAVDGIVVVDHHGRIIFLNRGAATMFGWDADEAVGKPLDVLLPAPVAESHRHWVDAFVRTGTSGRAMGVPAAVLGRRHDGSTFPAQVTITRVPTRNRIVAAATIRDLSDHHDDRVRYRSVFENAVAGIVQIGPGGEVLALNPAMAVLLGASAPDDFLRTRTSLADLVDGAVQARLGRAISEGSDTVHAEVPLRRLDGEPRDAMLTMRVLRDHRGEYCGAIAVVVDVTARRRAEDTLRRQVRRDALTGLPNRVQLCESLTSALHRAARDGHQIAVLFVDLDRFKVVNDSLGHAVGDRVLVDAGRRISAAVEPGDIVVRFGGDEFVVVIDEISDVVEAQRRAARLIEAFDAPFIHGDRRLHVGLSVGIAMSEPGATGQSADDLVRAADTAMYGAKEHGRNGSAVFDDELRRRAVLRLDLEHDLREAVERGELSLHYQPIVRIDTMRLVGLEALLRWRHPSRGLIAPVDFIPVAEETGLIVRLGAWVLEQACRHFVGADLGNGADPAVLGSPFLCVNLSARQLADRAFTDTVTRCLDDSGLDPRRLCLEITETALVSDSPRAVEALTTVRALGVRVALDDFGTGYGSLAQLRSLPIDIVKIDRSFIEGLGSRTDDEVIVATILAMAGSLGLTVVAEGIERPEQLSTLRAMRAAYGQGYLIARPAPIRELGLSGFRSDE